MLNDDEYTLYFDVVEFLLEYEKLPGLWDRNHEDHRNFVKRDEYHITLSKALGIYDLSTLKRKIRNIRGSYNTEIRKIKASLGSPGKVHEPKLFWFPLADRFLRVTTDLSVEEFPFMNFEDAGIMKKTILQKLPKEPGVTIVPHKKRRRSTESDFETTTEYEELEELESSDEHNVANYEEDEETHVDDEDTFQNMQHLETGSVSDKTVRPETEQLDSIIDFIKTLRNTPENEFTAFGKWVGLQLQSLPLELALQLQIDIQAHMMKTRLNHMENINDD